MKPLKEDAPYIKNTSPSVSTNPTEWFQYTLLSVLCILTLPTPLGDNTPSPQVDDDSPKRISEVEGSPDFQLPVQDDDEEDKPYNNDPEAEGDGVEEKEPDHDPCHSDGKVQLTIPNINQLSEQVLSSPIFIRNLPW